MASKNNPNKMVVSATENSAELITTSFLLSNLHCPSCVSHIENVLSSLDPRPQSISPSLLSSWVTVRHDKNLSERDILEALQDAGFDVCDYASDDAPSMVPTGHKGDRGENGYLDRFLNKLTSEKSHMSQDGKYSHRHLENCEACRSEAAGKNESGSSSASQSQQVEQDKSMRGFKKLSDLDLPLVVIDPIDSQEVWRASLAVGGMTCAACVNSITEELKKKDWIKDVSVNLITNSATVEFIGEQHKHNIVEIIEDIGFDATLDSVNNLKSLQEKAQETLLRTIEINVDGMFCGHCPARILTSMESFGDRVKVEKPLTLQDPIMTISYIPLVPGFTIRTIIEAISAVDRSLEPSIYHPPTLEERSRKIHARERQRIFLRVLLTLIIAVPTLLIGIVFMSLVPSNNTVRMWLMKPLRVKISRAQWALFIMATPVYFLCADVFHLRALKELRSMWKPGSTTPFFQRFYRFGSMNMLMSLGTSIAYFSSVAQLIAAGVSPPIEVDNSAFYFDSVVFLTLFLLIGRMIESYSKSKTGDAVMMLGKLRPTEALLVDSRSLKSDILTGQQIANGQQGEYLRTVKIDLLEFGDTVKVLHGASPPCDGIVIQGESKFDESSLTGESKLIKKAINDEVFSGTVNKESPISIKITGVSGSSMLDQIVRAVREGQTRRAPMERIADTLTGYFVPFVTSIAILTWVLWLSLGYGGILPPDYIGQHAGGWVAWSLQFAIAVFVVACPCGLALAAPTALFVGGGLAAQHGILVKGGGEAFEKASQLDCIVFDKTGTLTLGGKPTVTDFQYFNSEAKFGRENPEIRSDSQFEKTILEMVGSVEGNSSHTVANAISSFCQSRETNHIDVDDVEEIAGKGMKGSFHLEISNENLDLIVGNEHLLRDNNVSVHPEAKSTLDAWKSEGKSVALAAVSLRGGKKMAEEKCEAPTWNLVAIFAISDPIRPEAPAIIRALQKRGTQVWMLSGDNEITANAIGAQVGILPSNVIAGVLPTEKAEKIQYLQRSLKFRNSTSGKEHTQKRAIVAMVGDGINDSPALTTADVGIAIGSGSDIAISSAEFVLVSSNLKSLITLLDLSRFVFRRIKFNFGWALIYNLIALPVAAGALYPIVSKGSHVRLDPVWASLAMAASSISVVCSSLALRSSIPFVGFKVEKVVGE